MEHKIKPFIILLIIVGVIGAGYAYFTRYPDELALFQQQLGLIRADQTDGEYSVSGYIEADEINLAAEIKGRITRITVEEGDFVEADQVLVELDTALLDAEIAQAQAKIETAKAHLAKIKAGVRAEEISKAEAAVSMAQTNAEAARTLWQNAIMLRDNPQELEMQIDAAKTALELAELKIEYAIPLKDVGEAMWELRRWQRDDAFEETFTCKHGKCFTIRAPEGAKQQVSVTWNLAGADMWEAWVDLNTAVVERDNAEIALNDLLQIKSDPQEAQVQVADAEAAYQTAQVEVEVAQAQLDLLKAGARKEQIAVAQAQVEQAEAALASLTVQRNKHTLLAPLASWVVEQPAHEGEMATPGASLMTLADLNDVTLTVYVPEPDIDTISIGQTVDVFVDAFPGEAFTGHLIFINDEAEFTPKNVQTKEERINTVFAVKIKLDNEDQRLKPGMPADAILETGRDIRPVRFSKF